MSATARLTRRRQLLAATAAAAFAPLAAPARAQTFPSRGVKIIVPQTPGGASDTLARIVGQRLAELWKQPVVIENRPGAGGNIGMEAVARSPADGHTLLMSYVGTHAINGALYRNLPFDPERDFAAVATIATVPFVMAVNAKTGPRSVAEFTAQARARRMTFGSAGNGSVNHLLGEMFNAAAGVRVDHVPYRGAAPALNDLIGGQIDVVFTSLPSVAGFIANGSIRPLAVTSPKRSPAFRDIPTITESGISGFEVTPWFGLFAPAGTPAAVVRQINADVAEATRTPEVAEKVAKAGADAYLIAPEEFTALLRADIAKWAKVVRDAGAKLD
ncbi:MAG: tripartite tricarboxylate transporter substrate binding protein [Betaproteobacteria bacterium]|nr:tripartite tricarboxylate transporter substrate binding protein [Betaproteobacteria bacterium]